LTETWLKPDDYITLLNEYNYCYKHEPRMKGKGGGVAVIYSNIYSIPEKSRFKSVMVKIDGTPGKYDQNWLNYRV